MKRQRTNLKRKVKDGQASITEVMVFNAEDAPAYKIQDPSERLVATIGACMNEPKFYPTDPGSLARGYVYDTSDFDEQAQLVINTAMQVAESESPKDLVQIAHWARKQMRMRTIPQALLAIAAHCTETKKFVREYTPKIINRADELKQAFIAYRSLFGHNHALPNSLKRGLADAFKKFKPMDFVKYEGQNRPSFADILKMIDRRKGYPLSKDLDHYLKTGEVKNPEKLPQIYARQQLHKKEQFDNEAKQLAAKSRANWEVIVSQFGNKREVWNHLIDTEQLGYMAMLRNLRNMLQANIGSEQIDTVCKKLVSGAKDSKQLPYRFISAQQVLESDVTDSEMRKDVIKALDGAVSELSDTITAFPGKSLIAIDSSGSMGASISSKSKISLVKAAGMLAAMAYTNSQPGSVIGHFASTWEEFRGIEDMSPLAVANHAAKQVGRVGHSTNAEEVLRWAIENKKKFDRIIILSDMQTYGAWGYSIKELLAEYRKEINPDCFLHSFDLAGHGQSMTEQTDTKTNLVAGYSERLLDTVTSFEGILNKETGEREEQEFTLEYIRSQF